LVRVLECPSPAGRRPRATGTDRRGDRSAGGTLLAFAGGAVERRGEVVGTSAEQLRVAAAVRTTPNGPGGRPRLAAADQHPRPSILNDLLATVTVDGGDDDTVLLGLRWTS
jgi:hypothetical protein